MEWKEAVTAERDRDIDCHRTEVCKRERKVSGGKKSLYDGHLTPYQKSPTPSTSTMAFLLHFIVLLLLSPHPAAYPDSKCEGDNYDAGSLFQSNLTLLLSSLSSTNSTFITDDKGSPPNRAYGLFLCRGDITSLPLCHNCTLNATQAIQHLCPSSKQATVWYDTCQLGYSGLSFIGSYYDNNLEIDSAEQKATDPDTFIKLRGELLVKLFERAAYNSGLLFATGTASVGANDSPEIYGLVQCTRDLSKDKCNQCLQESFSDSLKKLDAVKGGRVLRKSCNFRYEAFKFFEGVPAVLLTLPPSSPPPSSIPTQQKDDKGKKKLYSFCLFTLSKIEPRIQISALISPDVATDKNSNFLPNYSKT